MKNPVYLTITKWQKNIERGWQGCSTIFTREKVDVSTNKMLHEIEF